MISSPAPMMARANSVSSKPSSMLTSAAARLISAMLQMKAGKRLHARDREVLQCALRLRRIERPLWHPYLADRVRLNAKFSHTRLLPFVVATVRGTSLVIKKSATIVAPFDFVENNKRTYEAAAIFSATCAQLITSKNAAM